MSLVPPAATIAAALAAARAAGLERRDALWLLGHLLDRPAAWLIAHDDQPLPPEDAQRVAQALAQAADSVPLAYLTGNQAFHRITLAVGPGVLVPRPDTELLVDWALALLPGIDRPEPRVLDLGTGSGAVVLALGSAAPHCRLAATDLSPVALAAAAANAATLGLEVQFHAGAWWQAVPTGARFELVVSNPPYIADDDPHLDALRHEPRLALTAGADGLDAIRAIVAGAPGHLVPGGWLLLEHGWQQAGPVAALLLAAGFDAVATRHDLGGRPRCTGGRWPGAADPAQAGNPPRQ